MAQKLIAVLDIGKTLSKLSLWNSGGEMLTRRTRPNRTVVAEHYDALDVDGIGPWVIETLAGFVGEGPIGAIIPVSHGAGVVVIRDGALVVPPLDYEFAIPTQTLAEYRKQRDPFSITGSPALPDGLNIGSQLHFLEELNPDVFEGAALLPWTQYWAWFLSGASNSEVTSLGCHSDLWSPAQNDFSPLAKQRRWAEKFAPIASAGDIVGTLRPNIAKATGLTSDTAVYCGLHDSNAALVAARGFDEIADNDATILSTGTWFVAMRTPRDEVDLSSLGETRDCLINVDFEGRAIPSGRFMGGREIETLIGIDTRRIDIKPDQPALMRAAGKVVESGAMILPTLANGFGPFPHGRGRWVDMPDEWPERRAAACLYAALVADVTLELVGAKDVLLIEGRFAEAEVFVRALASLRPEIAVYTANAHNDVSYGALRLLNARLKPKTTLSRVEPLKIDLERYRREWRRRAERAERGA